MIQQGDVLSYIEMCSEAGCNLQKGMNCRLKGRFSVILMNVRAGAPYADYVEDNGKILIYEGHDPSQRQGTPNPRMSDQPMNNPSGSLTQNGLFFQVATNYKMGKSKVELVKVYEKIRSGIWVYNGLFRFEDAWMETTKDRIKTGEFSNSN